MFAFYPKSYEQILRKSLGIVDNQGRADSIIVFVIYIFEQGENIKLDYFFLNAFVLKV